MIAAAPADFTEPDLNSELDLDKHLAALPVNGTIKGTIAESVLDAVRAAKLPPITTQKYVPFRDYKAREILELQTNAVRALYPDVSLREGLRMLGRAVFPAFAGTLIGRVMYGVFGNNVGSIFKLANKSFELTQNMGRVRTMVLGKNAVRMSFSNTHTFLSSYHVGVVEGTLAACRLKGRVMLKLESETEGDLHVAWESSAVSDLHAST